MANIYLTEQGSILRKTGDRLLVEKDHELLLDVQCHKIDAVLIFGNVQVTTPALHELLQQDIELAFLTTRGRLIGQITSPATKNVELRIAQYERYRDAGFLLEFARGIVRGKIKNAIELLRRYAYSHPAIDLREELDGLAHAEAEAQAKRTMGELTGTEGSAARIYFAGLGKAVLGEFAFAGRNKRPPRDPVNALLSLGYTLVFNEIASLLDGVGFDPYLGFYHKPDYGRASLAADLLEEFRAPLVDRFTLALVNNRILKNDDFAPQPNKGGTYLKKDSLKRYFVEYEHFVMRPFHHPETGEETDFRRCFRRQIQKLSGAVRGEETYSPFFFDR